MIDNPWGDLSPNSKIRVNSDTESDIFWAKDKDENFIFSVNFGIYFFNLKTPKITGVEIFTFENSLYLKLNDKKNTSLFFTLCMDLIKCTKNKETSGEMIINRLEKWQQLFKRLNNGILPEDKIKGLIGELYFILNILTKNFSMKEALECWSGPDGANQDFNASDTAIEVKCKSGSSQPKINISSENQLDSTLTNLYLFVTFISITRSYDENRINLSILINRIKDCLIKENSSECIDILYNKLFSVGYIENEYYENQSFLVSSYSFYEVTKDFPKIMAQELPPEISNVKYQIEINKITRFLVDEDNLIL